MQTLSIPDASYQLDPVSPESLRHLFALYAEDKYSHYLIRAPLCFAETLKDLKASCFQLKTNFLLVHPLSAHNDTEEIVRFLEREDPS